MKKILLSMLIVYITATSHAQNPCNMRWTNWQTVMTHSWGNVSIKIQYTDCDRYGGNCGWPKIALEHSFNQPVKLDVTLEGVDCEGKTQTSSFSTGGNDINPNLEYINPGNWHTFKRVDKCVRVEVTFYKGDDYYRILLDTKKGISQIYKNNSPMNANGRTAEEEQKIKEQQEEEKRKKQEEEENKKKQEEEAKKQKEEEQKKKDEENQKLRESAEKKQAYEDSMRIVRYRDSLAAIEEDRNTRLKDMKQQDDKEKATMGVIGAGVLGVGLSENTNNKKTDKKLYAKAELNVMYIQVPAITNTSGRNPIYKWSSYDAPGYMGGGAAVHLGFRPAPIAEIYVKPVITYGMQLGDGVTGTYMDYGGIAGVRFGKKFKIGAEAEYYSRTGDYHYDGDAANASLGIYTNDALITETTFDYTVLRYGGYVLVDVSKVNDSYLQLGGGMEVPSYQSESLIYYKLKLVLGKFFIAGSYITDYPVYGKAIYRLGETKKQDFFDAKLGVVFNL